MIDPKQLSQARLLGRCLAGMLAINLLMVGLAFWTRTGAASVEAVEAVPMSQPVPIASAPQTIRKPNEPIAVKKVDPPAPVQAKSVVPPPQAASPKIASVPPPPQPAVIKVESPSETRLPTEEPTPAVLRLVNPSETRGVVYYAVDGKSFSLSPGEYHEFVPAAECLLEFHRGGEFGYAKLNLLAGDYLFIVGESGWRLTPGKMAPVASLNRAN